MSKREKTLAALVGLAGAIYLGGSLVWPVLNEHVFSIAAKNDEREMELRELQNRLDDIQPYREDYKQLLGRSGSTDGNEVRAALYARLTALVEDVGLSNPRVTPKNLTDYRPPGRRSKKTDIRVVRFSVTADGTFASIMNFLKAGYELPYISQFTDVTLDPPSGRSAKRGEGLVRLSATYEAIVPPLDRTAEVNPKLIKPVATHVKHENHDYALVSERAFFKEYVPPPPPNWACCYGAGQCEKINAQACISKGGSFFENETCGQVRSREAACKPPVACCLNDQCVEIPRDQCEAQGGEIRPGRNKCKNVRCKEEPPPQVATNDPKWACCYGGGVCGALTSQQCVSRGGSFFENQQCTQVRSTEAGCKPPNTGDPDRNSKVIRMAMVYDDVAEVMVVNTQSKQSDYVRLGEELDGGNIVLVHALGAASRREDGTTRIYPVGYRLADAMLVENAVDVFPEVVFAYESIRETLKAADDQTVDEESGDGEGNKKEGESASKEGDGKPKPPTSTNAPDAESTEKFPPTIKGDSGDAMPPKRNPRRPAGNVIENIFGRDKVAPRRDEGEEEEENEADERTSRRRTRRVRPRDRGKASQSAERADSRKTESGQPPATGKPAITGKNGKAATGKKPDQGAKRAGTPQSSRPGAPDATAAKPAVNKGAKAGQNTKKTSNAKKAGGKEAKKSNPASTAARKPGTRKKPSNKKSASKSVSKPKKSASSDGKNVNDNKNASDDANENKNKNENANDNGD